MRVADAEVFYLRPPRRPPRGRPLSFPLSGPGPRGEVHRHRVSAAFVSDRHATDDIGAERRPLLRVLAHELLGPVRIGPAALHELDEAGVVRVAVDVDRDVGAVAERDLAGEELRDLRPPPVLLGSVAVAPGGVRRLEPDQRDEPAILGDTGGGAEPPGGPGREMSRQCERDASGPVAEDTRRPRRTGAASSGRVRLTGSVTV